MHCTKRDQDLLLMQHGELSPWRTFWVQKHIQSCPHCQEKQAEYARISRLVAGAIRQDGNLPAFAFRGETGLMPRLASTMPRYSTLGSQPYRPVFVATVSVCAALIAVGAYAYKAMALSPVMEMGTNPTGTIFHARASFSPGTEKMPKDSSGRPTIFPYSTPNIHENCTR